MRGRYPNYNVLEQAGHWDEVTRRLVLDRVENVPSVRFFTAPEALTLGAFCDLAAPQHGAVDFVKASEQVRERVVEAFPDGELHGEVWDDLPPARAWKVVTRALLSAFYSHPWAWNEIGFGGPAYPRGYARLGARQRENWEGAPAFERDPVKDTEQLGYWTEERIIGGSDPVELGKNKLRPRRRRLDGPLRRLLPTLPPLRLRGPHPRRGGGGLADLLPDLKPHYERLELELPVAGDYWPWGDPHRYPHTAHLIAGGAEVARAAPAGSGSRCASVRSGSPTVLSATDRTASTAGSASRGAR
jgi:Gluconate 2-dehydrogenase subunit 3